MYWCTRLAAETMLLGDMNLVQEPSVKADTMLLHVLSDFRAGPYHVKQVKRCSWGYGDQINFGCLLVQEASVTANTV